MAAQNTFVALIILLGSIVCGCKTASDTKPFRLDSLMSRQEPKTAEKAGASKPSPSNFVMSRPLTDYVVGKKNEKTTSKSIKLDQNKHPSLASRFRTATASVKDALTIEPKVIAASDPTNLSHDPGPINPRLYLSAAALSEQQGQLDRAADQYRKVLEIDRHNRGALIGLGRLLHRQGLMNDSISVYRRALSSHQNDPVILNDLALCYARTGRATEAISALETAVRLRPEGTLYRNNLAAVLVEAGQSDKAVQTLAQAYGPAIANYNVGYMMNQRGDAQAASAHFTQALSLDPSLKQARVMLNQIAPHIGTMPSHLRSPVEGRAGQERNEEGNTDVSPPRHNQARNGVQTTPGLFPADAPMNALPPIALSEPRNPASHGVAVAQAAHVTELPMAVRQPKPRKPRSSSPLVAPMPRTIDTKVPS